MLYASFMTVSVLHCPMSLNNAGAKNVREYLVALAEAVWYEGGEFHPRRPFGQLLWEQELYAALVRAGVVDGVFDSDGNLTSCDEALADHLVAGAFRELADGSR